METIFDHNPTEEEIKCLYGRVKTKEEHLVDPFSQGTEYAMIYRLYKRRGNKEMAEKYGALLSPDYRQQDIDMIDLIKKTKKTL